MFLEVSDKLEQSKSKLEKIIGTEKHAGKVRKNILPPLTLVIWMASKFPEDFSLKTASTAMLLKKSLWVVKILELKVVLKMEKAFKINPSY